MNKKSIQAHEENQMLQIICMIPILENCEYGDQLNDIVYGDLNAKEYSKLTGLSIKDSEELLDDRDYCVQRFKECCYGKILAQVATPVITPTGKGSCQYSWGYKTLHVILADDVDDVIKQGLEFVKERTAYWEKKAKADAKTNKSKVRSEETVR